MKRNLVGLFLFMITIACHAKEWRLTVLIDGAGLTKDAYGQIYKALTTEWPTQVYSLPVEEVSTKETVALQTVLFGIETYTLVANQFRFMPLSGQGKTVRDTEITVKDCAVDSLIDTIVERHKPLKDQFREQVESSYLATSDGVILLSLCPNLGNFQNGISPESKSKLQTIKLARLDALTLNSAVLSQDIKSARAAYDGRVTAAVKAPSNPDRMLERLAEMQRVLDAMQREVATKTKQVADVQGQMEKVRKDLIDKGAQLDLSRKDSAKKNQEIEALKEKLLGKFPPPDEAVRQLQKNLEDAIRKAEMAEATVVKANKTIEDLKKEIERLKKLVPPDLSPEPDPQPAPSEGWVNVLIAFVGLGGAGLAAWIFWPRKKWTVTIEREGMPEIDFILGKSAKPFSSAGDMGPVGSLLIRYSRQVNPDTGDKTNVFQLKAPVDGWSVKSVSSKTVLPPGEWCAELEANTRYEVYTDKHASTTSLRFTIVEQV